MEGVVDEIEVGGGGGRCGTDVGFDAQTLGGVGGGRLAADIVGVGGEVAGRLEKRSQPAATTTLLSPAFSWMPMMWS